MAREFMVASALLVAVCVGCAAKEAPPDGKPILNNSSPVGKPVLEEPTLHCLGAYWIIRGDENRNARVEVAYRQTGETTWKAGPNLFRVAKGDTTQAHRQRPGQRARDAELDPPNDCWIFAGSLLLLQPDTAYEIRLRLIDPDGGDSEAMLKSRTIGEPVAPKPLRTLHVVPGTGGGLGTEDDPYRGFATAETVSKPGDLVLVHKGIYNETLHVSERGEPGKPIIWRAASRGDVIIDGQDRLRFGIQAWLVHDVWFEGFTIRNVVVGISANDSHHMVIRRCHILPSLYGICFNGNATGKVSHFFVSDNLIEGPCKWPRTRGIENPGGLYMTGRGHVVCYNRVHHFADGIDTYNSKICAAIDVHNNDISECTDDGAEMDFSERNTRNFLNRYTNVFQGISEQPIMGGPTYIFRNVLYNVGMEPFKLHHNGTPKHTLDWAPSGAILFHNTVVRKGMSWLVWTPATIYNCVSRNNLFVGTEGEYAADLSCPAVDCDFDYDGFAGMTGRHPNSPAYEAPKKPEADPTPPAAGPFRRFLHWNGVKYDTLADVKKNAPAERHAVQLDSTSVFASGLLPPKDHQALFGNTDQDFRLSPACAAVDAGVHLPGMNDGFQGKAPDLGAYELGQELPHYGPRPE